MQGESLLKLRVSREEAGQKIQSQIEKGHALRDRDICSEDELQNAIVDFINWSKYNKTLLLKVFDSPSVSGVYNNRCSVALVTPAIRSSLDFDTRNTKTALYKELGIHRERIDNHINHLKGICDRLELYDELSDTPQRTVGNNEVSDKPTNTLGNEVFIVHGHDDGAKANVARFVEHLGIKPIILHEQPNRGLTIIEKIEKYSRNAGFAIVLLTPDDIGALNDNSNDESNTRARQNVVFELGYFMGKLGRERVCPLFKGEIEKPSDIDGIVYVPMDNADGWQLKLAKEMKQAGLPIDPEKLL